ncbi:MAG TPA: helix-turn-helix transcriptional regulator [Polyangia bacterium]|jgi:excisionase family DNA binding protein
MAEYLSTREVARYLKLNQKKVYALVAAGQLPAARISGKWLFPRHLIDEWVARHTVHPDGGVMGALLDEMVVLQGSDDWLLWRVIDRFQERRQAAVPTAVVGSLAGLAALRAGHAHVASCHVDLAAVRDQAPGAAYLVELFTREQGLIYDRSRTRRLPGLAAVAARRLRFAERQAGSGTYRLVRRLLGEAGAAATWTAVGPYSSHLELALAIRAGDADVGVGARIAAAMTGLAFAPLAVEPFDLLVPAGFAAHPRMAGFLEFALEELGHEAAHAPAGYSFTQLGRMQALGAGAAGPPAH